MDEPREGGMDRPMTRRELRALEEARRAAVQPAAEPVPAEVAAPAVEAAVEPEAAAEQPVAPQPVVERPVPAAVPAPVQRDWATTSGTTWSDDVRWSLHGELPRALPPEPADDDIPAALDVSADASAPVAAPTAPQPPQATPARGFGGAPARVSAWGGVVAATTPAQPPQSVPPPPPAPSATPVWQVVPQWNVTPETGSAPARVEEWPTEEPAGWAAADVAPDAVEPDEQPYEPTYEPTVEPTFEQADAYEVADEGVESYEQAYEQPYEQAYEQPYEEYEQPSAEAQPYGDYAQVPAPLPTLDDLIAARPGAPAGPAEQGWRGSLRRITGGLLAIRPGPAEREHREAVASLQRPLDGPRTIVVINPKGGAHKTTATLLLAATFGQHRGGYTLAWDNNETRGTLGWRAQPSTHQRTAVTLLQDLEKFADSGAARVGDLDSYVRPQGSAQFDVLASDEDAASAASIDGFAFRALHRTLSRFYRVMVVDTGNNLRASNWQAAVQAADQVVIVSTVREDTAQSAAWAVDALRAQGYEDVVRRAVTVLSDPAPKRDPLLAARLHDHFGRLTRAVVDVPYDKALVGGAPLHVDLLDRRTREAWLRVAAVVAEGL